MKKSNFKIGDRVVVKTSAYFQGKVGNKIGTVVAIDGEGDWVVKMDEDVNTYNYCAFTGYQSDRNDLINIEIEQGEEIVLLEDEKI